MTPSAQPAPATPINAPAAESGADEVTVAPVSEVHPGVHTDEGPHLESEPQSDAADGWWPDAGPAAGPEA